MLHRTDDEFIDYHEVPDGIDGCAPLSVCRLSSISFAICVPPGSRSHPANILSAEAG